jgi:hypothetical protein
MFPVPTISIGHSRGKQTAGETNRDKHPTRPPHSAMFASLAVLVIAGSATAQHTGGNSTCCSLNTATCKPPIHSQPLPHPTLQGANLHAAQLSHQAFLFTSRHRQRRHIYSARPLQSVTVARTACTPPTAHALCCTHILHLSPSLCTRVPARVCEPACLVDGYIVDISHFCSHSSHAAHCTHKPYPRAVHGHPFLLHSRLYNAHDYSPLLIVFCAICACNIFLSSRARTRVCVVLSATRVHALVHNRTESPFLHSTHPRCPRCVCPQPNNAYCSPIPLSHILLLITIPTLL